jgi:hypothetical protein
MDINNLHGKRHCSCSPLHCSAQINSFTWKKLTVEVAKSLLVRIRGD